MRKKGIHILGIIIWSAFTLLGTFVFNRIISDMEGDRQLYRLMLIVTTAVLLIAIVLYHVVKGKQENANYAKFESLFPELTNGILDIEDQASVFSKSGQVAIFKNYFIGNWEFDFIDLTDVENVYYERSQAIRNRRGAVVGDNPQLVFSMANHNQKVIKITPFGLQDYLPEMFEAMRGVNSTLTFGEERVGLSDYLPIFAKMR